METYNGSHQPSYVLQIWAEKYIDSNTVVYFTYNSLIFYTM